MLLAAISSMQGMTEPQPRSHRRDSTPARVKATHRGAAKRQTRLRPGTAEPCALRAPFRHFKVRARSDPMVSPGLTPRAFSPARLDWDRRTEGRRRPRADLEFMSIKAGLQPAGAAVPPGYRSRCPRGKRNTLWGGERHGSRDARASGRNVQGFPGAAKPSRSAASARP